MASSSGQSLTQIQAELEELAPNRYTLEQIIGKGSYGIVIKATDKLLNCKVAIKKVLREIFQDQLLSKRIFREIRLLAHFNHENIIGLRNLLAADPFEEIFIVMDIMETDLKAILRSKQRLTQSHVQYFIYQILRAIKCIHGARVIHRDLTPSNVLLNTNCDLKICDFGLARENRTDEWQVFTDYVTMRWYRAPELVMEDKRYGEAIDIWSLGCIMGEMFMGRTLFPGRDRINQLDRILQVIGTPSEEDIVSIGSQAAHKYIKRKPIYPKVDLRTLLPAEVPESAIDLMDRMLQFNPSKRITVDEALEHPFMEDLHDPSDEQCTCSGPFVFEDTDIKDNAVLKQHILEEIKRFAAREQAGRETAIKKSQSGGGLDAGLSSEGGGRTYGDGAYGVEDAGGKDDEGDFDES